MRIKTQDKHQRILDAAVKVFAQKGFFLAKVSEIAREAEVADGTVYLYFQNKDDLLISIFEVKMRDAIARFRTATLEKKDARSRLECLVRMHFAEFQANPDLAAVFQVELRQSSRFMREYAKGELREYLNLIGEILEAGQQEGLIRKDLPMALVKGFVFGALDEQITAWVLGGMKYRLEPLIFPLVDLFLRGMGETSIPNEGGSAG